MAGTVAAGWEIGGLGVELRGGEKSGAMTVGERW
jgi:hypothetical protein